MRFTTHTIEGYDTLTSKYPSVDTIIYDTAYRCTVWRGTTVISPGRKWYRRLALHLAAEREAARLNAWDDAS